jgi:hypothetical protein
MFLPAAYRQPDLFNPQSIQTMHVLGTVTVDKGIEARDFPTFTFSHWANKLRFFIEYHPSSKAN